MAVVSLIPMLGKCIGMLVEKLHICKERREGSEKRSEIIANLVPYDFEKDKDSSLTTVGSFIERCWASLIRQLEITAEMVASKWVESAVTESIPSFTFSILPPELIFLIISDLPVHSRACLALTERYLHIVLKNQLKSECLHIPTEKPHTFLGTDMSKPFNYQPERWAFLSLLETDLLPLWRLCAYCFKLHPPQEFAPKELFRKSHSRRCRIWAHISWIKPPLGIVDVCPCIKLTVRDKIKLEKILRNFPGSTGERGNEPLVSNNPVTALCPPSGDEFWWHECRQTYGSLELTTKVKPLLGRCGELFLITRYEYQRSSGATLLFSRATSLSSWATSLSSCLCCPHRPLDTWMDEVLRGRMIRSWNDYGNTRYANLNNCRYCTVTRRCT